MTVSYQLATTYANSALASFFGCRKVDLDQSPP
ncbi:MAG: hypothetical protein QOJ59_2769 [Thermomicrobiales bacterium]|jgi:hypothetical protein|nr:hypothetical protein [Thermomicrobiales bacterium]